MEVGLRVRARSRVRSSWGRGASCGWECGFGVVDAKGSRPMLRGHLEELKEL